MLRGLCFIAVYVPPRDSPFYTPNCLAIINEICQKHSGQIVILGDINARMNNLEDFSDQRLGLSYEVNVDPSTNANGRELRGLMKANNLKPVNHMSLGGRTFQGGMTFRKRATWVSQLDWAIVSLPLLKQVQEFKVMNQTPVPYTDHAPIALHIS